MSADDILSLAHQAGQTNPLMGWDWFAINTTLHADLMAATGNAGINLVECLDAVGLQREDVVEAWRLGKLQAIADAKTAKAAEAEAKIKGKDAAKAAALAVAEKAKPVVASAAPEPLKEQKSEPTLKPVPCRTDVVEKKMAQKGKAKPAKAPTPPQEQASLF